MASFMPRRQAVLRDWVCRGLFGATVACGAMLVFNPRPYRLVVGAMLTIPWIAVAVLWRWPGIPSREDLVDDQRPLLIAPLILSGPLLAVRAIQDIALLHPLQLVVPVALVSLAMAFAAARDRDRASRRFSYLLTAMIACYAASAAALLDGAFDASQGQVFSAQVLEKTIESGRVTRRRLKLSAWGPRRQVNFTHVSKAVYGRAEVGQPVQVVLRDGLLHMPWFYVDVP